jgi:hypothetical protein
VLLLSTNTGTRTWHEAAEKSLLSTIFFAELAQGRKGKKEACMEVVKRATWVLASWAKRTEASRLAEAERKGARWFSRHGTRYSTHQVCLWPPQRSCWLSPPTGDRERERERGGKRETGGCDAMLRPRTRQGSRSRSSKEEQRQIKATRRRASQGGETCEAGLG